MGYIIASLLVLIVGGVSTYFYIKRQKEAKKKNNNNNNPYAGLRSQIFNLTPESINILVQNENQSFATVMEIGFPKVVVTLVSFGDGNASLYFSNGGGIIGGFAHENVREVSIEFVNQSNSYIKKMDKTISYEMPNEGMVRFYIMTKGGIYYHEDEEIILQEYKSEFTNLYAYGQNVITELRQIPNV